MTHNGMFLTWFAGALSKRFLLIRCVRTVYLYEIGCAVTKVQAKCLGRGLFQPVGCRVRFPTHSTANEGGITRFESITGDPLSENPRSAIFSAAGKGPVMNSVSVEFAAKNLQN